MLIQPKPKLVVVLPIAANTKVLLTWNSAFIVGIFPRAYWLFTSSFCFVSGDGVQPWTAAGHSSLPTVSTAGSTDATARATVPAAGPTVFTAGPTVSTARPTVPAVSRTARSAVPAAGPTVSSPAAPSPAGPAAVSVRSAPDRGLQRHWLRWR